MLASGNNLMHSVILLEIIKQSLESVEDVMISGFGKFQVRYKRQCRGRNPATNKDLILPPKSGRLGAGIDILERNYHKPF